MTTAVLAVHLRGGVWNSNGGYELPLVYATAAAALAFTGPGAYSLGACRGLKPPTVRRPTARPRGGPSRISG